MLSVDLGIEEKYKPIIEKHIKFFANKERTQRFYDLEIENFNEENILVGLLSAICKTRTCSFEEVLRIVLTEGDIEENAFLEEFEENKRFASGEARQLICYSEAVVLSQKCKYKEAEDRVLEGLKERHPAYPDADRVGF